MSDASAREGSKLCSLHRQDELTEAGMSTVGRSPAFMSGPGRGRCGSRAGCDGGTTGRKARSHRWRAGQRAERPERRKASSISFLPIPWPRACATTASSHKYACTSPSVSTWTKPITSSLSTATTVTTPGAVKARRARSGSAGREGYPSASQRRLMPGRCSAVNGSNRTTAFSRPGVARETSAKPGSSVRGSGKRIQDPRVAQSCVQADPLVEAHIRRTRIGPDAELHERGHRILGSLRYRR